MAKTLQALISPDNREQTYLKYWLDLSLYRCFESVDNSPPVLEDWIAEAGPLFTGILRVWVNRAITKGDCEFVYSLQKGSKRYWPELGLIKRRAAYQKHRERLVGDGTPRQTPLELREKIAELSYSVFLPIAGTAASKFLPTGGACMQAGRRQGGALSLIEPFDLKHTMSFTDTVSTSEDFKLGKLRYLNHRIAQWRQDQYMKVYDLAWAQCAESSDPSVTAPGLSFKVVAIPEPGKFRIVTLGDGYLYSAIQPLQGLMLSAWKRRGESTMLRDDLTERVNEIHRNLPDLELWCSVDYEAATDLLYKDASLAAFAGAYPLPGGDLGMLSLQSGKAYYPRIKERKDGSIAEEYLEEDAVETKEGQLMGHPLSFPLLCVINLAVYHRSLEVWVSEGSPDRKEPVNGWQAISERERRQGLADKMRPNVLVNGDDMMFKCELSFYVVFLRVSASCGFKRSTGKQYLSPHTVMMNSQVFTLRGSGMVRKGYLNMKLITGSSVKQGDSNALPTQITRDINKMITLTPWTACAVPAALNRFAKNWRDGRFQPNWYLPVQLGGLGMDPKFAPEGWKITTMQRKIAAAFVNDPRLVLFRKTGNSLPLALLADAVMKWTWIKGDYVPQAHESFDDDDEWMGRLSYCHRASLSRTPESYTGDDEVQVVKMVVKHRLKPMTDKTIEVYRNARLVGTKLPVCPPIAPIRVPRKDEFVYSRVQTQLIKQTVAAAKETRRRRMTRLASL